VLTINALFVQLTVQVYTPCIGTIKKVCYGNYGVFRLKPESPLQLTDLPTVY